MAGTQTTMDACEAFEDVLAAVGLRDAGAGDCRCPACGDSLYPEADDDEHVSFYCDSDCTGQAILDALGRRWVVAFPGRAITAFRLVTPIYDGAFTIQRDGRPRTGVAATAQPLATAEPANPDRTTYAHAADRMAFSFVAFDNEPATLGEISNRSGVYPSTVKTVLERDGGNRFARVGRRATTHSMRGKPTATELVKAKDVCTPRELQMLVAYARPRAGYGTVAGQLGVSKGTVQDAINRAFAKLGTRRRRRPRGSWAVLYRLRDGDYARLAYGYGPVLDTKARMDSAITSPNEAYGDSPIRSESLNGSGPRMDSAITSPNEAYGDSNRAAIRGLTQERHENSVGEQGLGVSDRLISSSQKDEAYGDMIEPTTPAALAAPEGRGCAPTTKHQKPKPSKTTEELLADVLSPSKEKDAPPSPKPRVTVEDIYDVLENADRLLLSTIVDVRGEAGRELAPEVIASSNDVLRALDVKADAVDEVTRLWSLSEQVLASMTSSDEDVAPEVTDATETEDAGILCDEELEQRMAVQR